jgi:energy-coupling factor transporter ATP-binding protein EcfA2
MALTYSTTSNPYRDAVQIARDGNIKIYYIDNPIDLIEEKDEDSDLEELITDLVDDVVDKLRISNLSTKKLLDIDADIISKDHPTGRKERLIYNQVKDKLGELESKYYEGRMIELLPRGVHGQTDRLYISGSSGSGKSTLAGRFAVQYEDENPGCNVYLISHKPFDVAFDTKVQDLIRIPVDRNFIRETTADNIQNYNNSLIIFDDFLMIPDNEVRKAVEKFKNAVMELGRQYNINCISIQHKGLGGGKSITDLVESNIIVVFPKSNLRESMSLVSKYLCFTKDQFERVFDKVTRKAHWLAVIKPNIIVTNNIIKIID